MNLQSFLELFAQGAIVLLAIIVLRQWAQWRDRVSLDILLGYPAKTQVEAWLERGPEMADQDGSDGEGAQRIELIDMLAAALAQRTERSDRHSKGSLMNGGRVRAAGARCRPAGGLR